jgi:hypothetical protein
MKLTLDENHWEKVYDGYGEILIEDEQITLCPKIAESANDTHAALVTSLLRVKDFRIKIKATTVRQLRENTPPNDWEVFWIFFNYNPTKSGKKTTNYFLLKPNGYELGSAWGETSQCFIATGDIITLDIGEECTYEITKSENFVEIKIDGTEIFSGNINSDDIFDEYGYIGLYSEDAEVIVSSFEFSTELS